MIACQLFKRIEIGRNYAITCELNMTYQQFCEEWSNTEISKKWLFKLSQLLIMGFLPPYSGL